MDNNFENFENNAVEICETSDFNETANVANESESDSNFVGKLLLFGCGMVAGAVAAKVVEPVKEKAGEFWEDRKEKMAEKKAEREAKKADKKAEKEAKKKSHIEGTAVETTEKEDKK